MNIVDVTGEIEVEALGVHGDGRAGDLVIPQTLPGDVIKDGKIITPSAHRITPACRHFGVCGGCLLQHGAPDFLAEWKSGLVVKALQAQGIEAPVRQVHSSPPASRRRVVFSGRRTKKTVQLGFFERRSEILVPISECHLLVPEIMQAFETLQALVRLAATRTSVVKVAVATSHSGLDVAVTNGRILDRHGLEQVALIAGEFARLSWNGDVVLQQRPPAQKFATALVVPPPGAFLQATAEGEAALVASVLEGVGPARQVIDLFSGCGTFSLPLATVCEVHAVEFDGDMTDAMMAGWREATRLKTLTSEVRDLFRRPVLRSELNRWDAVVLDPPRAGAEAQVKEIAASDVSRVVHVSCNPVTFAREAKTLTEAGFTLEWINVVDQFLWSAHVELVGCFCR